MRPRNEGRTRRRAGRAVALPSARMKALRCHSVGSLEGVSLDEVDRPAPGASETLVRVVAAGVNPIDAKIVTTGYAGLTLPRTLGIDFAGTVEAGGSFAPGTRVFGSSAGGGIARDGTFAEFAAVDSSVLVALPGGIAFEAAAALGVICLTAHMAVIDAPSTRAEDTVLVHGAGGGVGAMCVQLASRVIGARTIAVVSGEDGAARARALGAHETIDRKRADVPEAVRALTHGRGADVIVDTVGGAVFESSVGLLAPFGRLVSLGLSAGEHRRVQLDLVEFYRANRRIVGVGSGAITGAARGSMLAHFVRWIAENKIRVPVPDVMPLARGVDALARMLAPEGARGKVVLSV